MKQETFGERLKELREEKNIGQKQLAKAIGYSAGVVSLWENNLREPGSSAVVELCKFFNVSADYLLGLSNY